MTILHSFLKSAHFRASANNQRLYLTYDDGPDPEVTPELLSILQHYNAQATFFVVASAELWWGGLLQKIAERGHAVGLHALVHHSHFWCSNASLYRDLQRLHEEIRTTGVEPLKVYRPPYGHVRPDQVRYLQRRGYETILWSNALKDYRPTDPAILFERVKPCLRPGAILDLHDGTPYRPAPTLEVTRRLLEYVKEKNWQTAALDSSSLSSG